MQALRVSYLIAIAINFGWVIYLLVAKQPTQRALPNDVLFLSFVAWLTLVFGGFFLIRDKSRIVIVGWPLAALIVALMTRS